MKVDGWACDRAKIKNWKKEIEWGDEERDKMCLEKVRLLKVKKERELLAEWKSWEFG